MPLPRSLSRTQRPRGRGRGGEEGGVGAEKEVQSRSAWPSRSASSASRRGAHRRDRAAEVARAARDGVSEVLEMSELPDELRRRPGRRAGRSGSRAARSLCHAEPAVDRADTYPVSQWRVLVEALRDVVGLAVDVVRTATAVAVAVIPVGLAAVPNAGSGTTSSVNTALWMRRQRVLERSRGDGASSRMVNSHQRHVGERDVGRAVHVLRVGGHGDGAAHGEEVGVDIVFPPQRGNESKLRSSASSPPSTGTCRSFLRL